MKIPNISCEIEISCPVNSSEDPTKITKSISNIFPNSEIKTEKFSVIAHSKNLNSLEKIYETIHSKKSQKTYTQNLEDNLENNSTWFYLNKQAAYVEQVVICEEAEESPLGPIKVILTSSNIDGIIDWMVFDN
jgi:hypothetical protein